MTVSNPEPMVLWRDKYWQPFCQFGHLAQDRCKSDHRHRSTGSSAPYLGFPCASLQLGVRLGASGFPRSIACSGLPPKHLHTDIRKEYKPRRHRVQFAVTDDLRSVENPLDGWRNVIVDNCKLSLRKRIDLCYRTDVLSGCKVRHESIGSPRGSSVIQRQRKPWNPRRWYPLLLEMASCSVSQRPPLTCDPPGSQSNHLYMDQSISSTKRCRQ